MKKFLYTFINEEKYLKIWQYSRCYYFDSFVYIIGYSLMFCMFFPVLFDKAVYKALDLNPNVFAIYLISAIGILFFVLFVLISNYIKIICTEIRFKVFKSQFLFWFIIFTYILLVIGFFVIALLQIINEDNFYFELFSFYISKIFVPIFFY